MRAGLAAVPETADVIVVHDAARPLASPDLFAAVIGAVRDGADAALPGVPVVDTLRRRDGDAGRPGRAGRRPDPAGLRRPSRLRAVHAGEPEATDDASLIDAAGGTVVVVVDGERGEPQDHRTRTTSSWPPPCSGTGS